MKQLMESWKSHLHEERGYEDNIYEVLIRLSISKKQEERGATTLISELLTDIRAITRVTVVDPIQSSEDPRKKHLEVKVKFNTKKLGKLTIKEFVGEVLLPSIRKLDSHPVIKFVSLPQDHIR